MKVAVTTLAFCVAALLALGMVMLYSTSMGMVMRAPGTPQVGTHYLMMQLIWCALGLGLCMTATSLDYRLLKKVAWPLFILAVVLLALVLEKHLGSVRGHARRWFSFGSVSFQPSNSPNSRSSSCWPGMASVFSGKCTPGCGASSGPGC